MMKIVPDPPALPPGTILKTAETAFGCCDAVHDPMFTVRGGIGAEDALVHISLFLQSVYATANAACNQASMEERGLHWATMHSVEIAKALVDALLDGAEGLAPK
ncbi:DUF6124 family protein [Pseudomonas akapageensis]|uniref:DUF6124 family protein n=1 Tax=Pseudomonas akapageensis TaxID=2609961 RepID=UPI001408B6CC|nr:DUF3077 domain-containing protein [Pseudomonas akapageensis]